MHDDETEARDETKQNNNILQQEVERKLQNLNRPFCKRYICVLYHQSYHNIQLFHIPTFHTFTYAYIKG